MSEVKEVTLGSIISSALSWLFGIGFIAGAGSFLVEGHLFFAILYGGMAVIILPPLCEWLATHKKIRLSAGVKFALVLMTLFIEARYRVFASGTPSPQAASVASAQSSEQSAQRDPNETSASESAQPNDLKEAILKEFGGAKKYWKEVTFEHDPETDFAFTITYKKSLSNLDLPEKEAIRLARTTLKHCLKAGHKPSDETLLISVHAILDAGKGESGEDLVRSFGNAYYDYNSDAIRFKGPNE